MSRAHSLASTTTNIVVENDTAQDVILCFNFSFTAARLPVGTSWVCICNTLTSRNLRDFASLIWLNDQELTLVPIYASQPNEARFRAVGGPDWVRQPRSRDQNPTLEIVPKIAIDFNYHPSRNISVLTDACCCDQELLEFNVRRNTAAAAPKPQPPPGKPDQHGGSSAPVAHLYWVSPGS